MVDEQDPIDGVGATPTGSGASARTGVVRTIAHWPAGDGGELPMRGASGSSTGRPVGSTRSR